MKSESKLPQSLILIFVVFGFLFMAMSIPRFLPKEPDFLPMTAGMMQITDVSHTVKDTMSRVAITIIALMAAGALAAYLGKSSAAPEAEEIDPDRTLSVFEAPYDAPVLARINVVETDSFQGAENEYR